MKGERPRVCVVGSFVIDLAFRVEHRPGPGETMLARDFGMFLGGKGFNQAVAARRLGADTSMVGRVGNDPFGDMFFTKLEQEGIDSSHVTRELETGTAIASPVIDASGENSIIAAPRANMQVTTGDVDAATDAIAASDILMLQFEIPVTVSRRAADIAREHRTLVMLDPAPVEHGFERFSAPLDYIVPNEIEAHMLTGRMTLDEWGAALLPATRQGVVISLGDKGAAAFDRKGRREFPAHRVDVVDTTGAGDAFRAGLAVTLAQGKPLDDAVRFANACGALACTIMGAEPSMPRLDSVELYMAGSERSE